MSSVSVELLWKKNPPHPRPLPCFSHLCLVILPAALNAEVISQFTAANRRLPTKCSGREAQHLGGQDKKETVIERLSRSQSEGSLGKDYFISPLVTATSDFNYNCPIFVNWQ